DALGLREADDRPALGGALALDLGPLAALRARDALALRLARRLGSGSLFGFLGFLRGRFSFWSDFGFRLGLRLGFGLGSRLLGRSLLGGRFLGRGFLRGCLFGSSVGRRGLFGRLFGDVCFSLRLLGGSLCLRLGLFLYLFVLLF